MERRAARTITLTVSVTGPEKEITEVNNTATVAQPRKNL